MNNFTLVDLFVEDQAHEEFLKAMISRIAEEEQKGIRIRVRSARGGHGRVLHELSLYQKSVLKAPSEMTIPDLVVVAIDANCKRWNAARKEIDGKVVETFKERSIVACPDPHIERWYLADSDSFAQVVGVRPRLGRKKCLRDYYKSILSKAIVDAGHPPTLGGIEFAAELLKAMDFYRASKADRSLKHFLEGTRARFKLL
ncbi:MAG: DUF4276 family protein [Woeseia sp.]